MTEILFLGEFASLTYIGGIAGVAALSGISYVLFPELAALAYDIFTRPKGAWAKAPKMLVFTPTVTAVFGVLIERKLGYGAPSILLAVASALLTIRLLRSPIAPAISAGVLPIVMEEGSWWYPTSVLFGTSMLAISSFVYARATARRLDLFAPESFLVGTTGHSKPKYGWFAYFLFFLLITLALVELTGLRLILFPPLIVIAFEMFAHQSTCPWAARPYGLVLACMSTAAVGVGVVTLFGTGPFPAMLSIGVGMALIRLLKLHVPPAAAVGLLPFVMRHPDYRFPLAVGIGTSLLVSVFLFYRKCFRRG